MNGQACHYTSEQITITEDRNPVNA